MPKHNRGCPKQNEIDVYDRCEFGCLYCVAKTQNNIGKTNFVDSVEILKKLENDFYPNLPFYLSPWTDCYTNTETEKRNTRKILEKLRSLNKRFFVITKSPLIMRDIDLFDNYPDSFIAISINTLDYKLAANLEPDTPSVNERKQLIEDISGRPNVKLVVKIDPIIPGITDNANLDELITWLKKVKPFAITADTLRINNDIIMNLKGALNNQITSCMMKHYRESITENPVRPRDEYRVNLLQNIAQSFSNTAIRTSFCQATLPVQITPNDCRGGF